MAYLFDSAYKLFIPLLPHHTFGRLGGRVDTQIDKPYISKLHSAIEWSGQIWRIRNLGINGTWVNGVALEQGKRQELQINDVIHFAKQTDSGYVVMDLMPPADMLWPLEANQMPSDTQTSKPIYLTRYHLLPDVMEPELALYYDDEDQRWYSEQVDPQHESQRSALRSGDKVQISGSFWQFYQAEIYSPTEANSNPFLKLNDFEFIFNLSLDEETTQLELHERQHVIDLAVRCHHNLLLQLARHRADDAHNGLDDKSQGWIYTDQLANELGMDSTHINIQIFRLRKQLADVLPNVPGQQHLLERRGGKIRFGCNKFKIFKGESLTSQLPLARIAENISK
jgi:FHA domain